MIPTDILLGLVAALVILKCLACLGSIALIVDRSAGLREALNQKAPRSDIDALYLELRPLHRFVDRRLPDRGSKVAENAIKGPVVVSVGAVATMLCASVGHGSDLFVLTLGVATGCCAVLHVLLALVESLAFGWRTRLLLHVRLPRSGPRTSASDWSIVREGNNLLIYFLGLLFMLALGFTALNLGISAFDPQSFTVRSQSSDIGWLYFSVATIATLGDDSISPRSGFAQLTVVAQIAMGPLLLSWLLAVFTGAGRPSRRPEDQN